MTISLVKVFQMSVGVAIGTVASYGVYLKTIEIPKTLISNEFQKSTEAKNIEYVLYNFEGKRICGSGDNKNNILQHTQENNCLPDIKIGNGNGKNNMSLLIRVSKDFPELKIKGDYKWEKDYWTLNFMGYLWTNKVLKGGEKNLNRTCLVQEKKDNKGKTFVEWYCYR
ncbi:hypothetical protein [Mycoplasma parvum]|uniref:Uncharacterized protein n=1 Tax=Mycoplasma parvum str. Indiana TaxID=1403316 RepID=U5ND94_9MOLU|nr:hypothetical protein [Mycoplasma parvum]AGX89310.1 hypothetical protein PRV_02920 [Mycoplasma parvum str. Indiana]